MKLLKLIIHNIASITDAEINFEAQPLASSEVFLITGKTGSGKSTILDAISLALFATTPRLKNTQMQGSSPEDEKIKINSPLQLMRRGTGEAWVKLAFLGNNGLHYEAEWSVARARKKETGKIQSKKWSLHIVEQSRDLIKDNDIISEINAAIGLDFNQFCRTTMLAQGEFTKFLNSKDDEKSAILEKITGVNVYSKIGAKVFEMTNIKKDAYRQANDRVSQVEILSDEQLNEINERLDQLNAENANLVKLRETVDGKKKWLEDMVTKTSEAAKANEELKEVRRQVESDDFKQRDALVNDWNATSEARTWLREKKAAVLAQEGLKQEMAHHQATFMSLKEGLLALENGINTQNTILNENRNKIAEQSDRKEVYAGYLAINEKLNNLHECKERIEKEQKTLDKSTVLLNGDLKTVKEKAEKEYKDKNDDLKAKQDAHATLEKELEACHIAELRKKQTELTTARHDIGTAKLMLENCKEAQQQVSQKTEAKKAIEKAVEELRNNLSGLAQVEKEATIARDAKRLMHDKLREGVEEWAKNIRSKLVVGDKCPVCQQEIKSAMPHEAEIDSIFAQVESELKDAENALEIAVGNRNKCEADIKAQEEMMKRVMRELSAAQEYSAAQEKKALDACRNCGVDVIESTTQQRLDEKDKRLVREIDGVKERLVQAEKIEQAEKAARKASTDARNLLDIAKQNIDKADAAITKCKSDIDTSNRVINDNKDQIAELSNKISVLLSTTKWEHNWKIETMEFADELKQSALAYNSLVENSQKLQVELEQSRKECSNVQEALEAIVAIVPQWKDVVPTVAIEVNNLLTSANNLRSQVAANQQQIGSETNREKELTANMENFIEKNAAFTVERLVSLSVHDQQSISAMQRDLQDVKNRVIACETAVKLKNKELDVHRASKPVLDENDTVPSLAIKIDSINRELSEIGQKIGAIKQQIETDGNNKKRLGELIAERDSQKMVFEQWDKLNKLIGDETGKKFRTIALSYILENLIYSANGYMRTLTDRYRLKVEPGTFVISVEDAYQGYASRAASTISGGESFLVSLALALALSDIAKRLQVDMLFIDEGFGTLSGEPLQNAINTLRTLHNATGRQVGIISHVDELKEKIPVQIQVNQEGNSSSSTITVVGN